MSGEKWSSETTMRFIHQFKSNACLWNRDVPAYKSKHAKEEAYRKIARNMDIPGFGVPEAKKKMRILRSTYCQEKKRMMESISSESGGDPLYVPNVPWYREMAVLMNDVPQNETVDSVNSTFNQTTENVIMEDRPEFINRNQEHVPIDEEDRFCIFGRSVAMQLRALSFERGMIGQAKIQNVLTELSVENYRQKNITVSTETLFDV